MKKFKIKSFTKSAFVMIMLMFTSVFNTFAQNPGSVDQTFSAAWMAASNIHSIMPLQSGKILVANDFSGSGHAFRRINYDGSNDLLFTTSTRNFVAFDTFPNGNIAAKTLDSLFVSTPNNDSIIFAIQLTSNNGSSALKTIVGSQFINNQINDYVIYATNHNELHLIDAITSIEIGSPYFILPALNNITDYILSIKTVNNQIFVGTNKGIFRFTLNFPQITTTASDAAFNAQTFSVLNNSEITTFDFQSDGSIIMGGYLIINGFPSFLVKIDSLGNIDSTFLSLPDNQVYSVRVDLSDKITIAGNFTYPNSYVVGLNSDGSLNTLFNTGIGSSANNLSRSVAFQTDGRILVSGLFSSFNSYAGRLVRLFGEEVLLNDICIATVDSLGHSNIVWNEVSTSVINYYKIYKFDVGGYQPIDSVLYSSVSEYIDQNSNQSQAEKYKISFVDTNGVESQLTQNVTTLFLQNSVGLSGENNLSWSPGQGFEITQYNIIRLDANFMDSVIDVVGFDSSVVLYSYTDWNPVVGTNYYVIEAISTANCSPSVIDPNSGSQKNAIGSSRSNRIITLSTGIKSVENAIGRFTAFPNPTNGDLTVKYELIENSLVKLSVVDIAGALVKSLDVDNKSIGQKTTNVNISDLSNGFYFLKASSKNGEKTIKIVKN